MEPLLGTLYAVNDADKIIDADVNAITFRDKRPHILLQQTDLAPNGGVSCFYTAAFRCAADAWPLDASERPLAIQAWKNGWAALLSDSKVVSGQGGRMADGVDYARRAWNAAFPNKQVVSYRGRCPRFDQDDATHIAFYRAMNFGWMVTVGLYASKDILADILDDGIVQTYERAGSGEYGHLVCLCQDDKKRWEDRLVVLDNYPKTFVRNQYSLEDFEKKVERGLMFPSYYLFLPKS